MPLSSRSAFVLFVLGLLAPGLLPAAQGAVSGPGHQWLTVTDTVTGATKTWHNPPGNYCGRGDVSAL